MKSNRKKIKWRKNFFGLGFGVEKINTPEFKEYNCKIFLGPITIDLSFEIDRGDTDSECTSDRN